MVATYRAPLGFVYNSFVAIMSKLLGTEEKLMFHAFFSKISYEIKKSVYIKLLLLRIERPRLKRCGQLAEKQKSCLRKGFPSKFYLSKKRFLSKSFCLKAKFYLSKNHVLEKVFHSGFPSKFYFHPSFKNSPVRRPQNR